MANSGDGLLGSSALRAISADFQSSDYDMKATIPLDLSFQAIKQITFELSNLAATQTSHVDVVAVHGFPLDWNNWMIHEWPDKLQAIQALTDLPVWVSEVGVSTFLHVPSA